jgi:hypothetical protein
VILIVQPTMARLHLLDRVPEADCYVVEGHVALYVEPKSAGPCALDVVRVSRRMDIEPHQTPQWPHRSRFVRLGQPAP